MSNVWTATKRQPPTIWRLELQKRWQLRWGTCLIRGYKPNNNKISKARTQLNHLFQPNIVNSPHAPSQVSIEAINTALPAAATWTHTDCPTSPKCQKSRAPAVSSFLSCFFGGASLQYGQNMEKGHGYWFGNFSKPMDLCQNDKPGTSNGALTISSFCG